jgi:predicted aconitase with swiveling domain
MYQESQEELKNKNAKSAVIVKATEEVKSTAAVVAPDGPMSEKEKEVKEMADNNTIH